MLGLVTLGGLVTLVVVWGYTYKLTISEQEISLRDLRGTHCLQWSEIETAVGTARYLTLKGKEGMIEIQLSAQQLDAYSDIVDLVRRKRPDLWKVSKATAFHKSKVITIGYSGFGSILIVGSIRWLFTGELFMGGMGILGGLICLLIAAVGVHKLTVKDRDLVIEYWRKQETVPISDIASVHLVANRSQQWINHQVELTLKNNRRILLFGFQEGSATVYNVLKQRLQDAKHARIDKES